MGKRRGRGDGELPFTCDLSRTVVYGREGESKGSNYQWGVLFSLLTLGYSGKVSLVDIAR